MNHLRNILSAKRVKYISTQDEILFDIGHVNEETFSDIQMIAADASLELTEVNNVGPKLKSEFYRAMQSSGQIQSKGSS